MQLHPYWMSFGYIPIGCLVVTSLLDVLGLHAYWMSYGHILISNFFKLLVHPYK